MTAKKKDEFVNVLCIHKINKNQWEVWYEGDVESDDLTKKELLAKISNLLSEQKTFTIAKIYCLPLHQKFQNTDEWFRENSKG